MVETINLSKQFGANWAVKEVNLQIPQGEFYCLLGPNGAGKTTTLKMLVGLIQPTQGEIYLLGKDIKNCLQEIKQYLGYIPDTPFVYENLTAWEYLMFIVEIFRLDKKTAQKKINNYLKIFQLENHKNQLLKSFSHGMKQKIIYIANLIHEPKILLVDEPLVGLDPASIHLIKNILKQKNKEGMTIIMSTHILSIAEELANKIGILYQGKLIAQGQIEEFVDYTKGENLETVFLEITKNY